MPKHPFCLCLCLLGPLALSATPSDQAPLGRLFFSPAERAELDRVRAGIIDQQNPATTSRTVRLDGMLQRQGKAPVLWVNGTRWKGDPVAGATLLPLGSSSGTLRVRMPGQTTPDRILKVGQTLDPAGGNLREVYQRPPQELNPLLRSLSQRGKLPNSNSGKTDTRPPSAAGKVPPGN